MIRYNDQRDYDDGVTVEDTLLPNVIGWGETPTQAVLDLGVQITAFAEVTFQLINELNEHGFDRVDEQ